MEEKKITKEEFNEAVHSVMEKQTQDPKFKENPTGLLLFTESGLAFATDLRRELFGGSEE